MESWILAAGLTSLALGGVLTLLGLNTIRHNRRRETARTALLTQLAFPDGMPGEALSDLAAEAGGPFRLDESSSEASVATETLFSDPKPSGAAPRRAAALAAVGVALVIVVGGYRWFASADTPDATSTAPVSDEVAAATTVTVPLPAETPPRVELLSLTHRATPAAFLVTGHVRNPDGAAPLEGVVAVVEVMDRQGRVLRTVRVPIERRELNPGDDAEFSATASNAANVAQYRVEFQNAARMVILHVDRRQKTAGSPSS